uniref:Uncharacterized protein n=1 Tax=Panagrolaimus sp. JU765 TaxID=591449 RepID=A0AC34Q7U9_9BILA
MTLSELEKFLQQYQVKDLSLYAMDRFIDEDYSAFLHLLMEPCRFVTALSIFSFDPEFNYADFYKKLKHLKSLTIFDSSGMIIDLPYFPPKLALKSEYSLSLLAEKTLNHPLSSLWITYCVSLTDIQQFLMTSNLQIGAEIYFRFKNQFAKFNGFLTFIGNGLFEFQMLRGYEYLILDQQMNSQNKKTLKLLTDFWRDFDERIPFTVTSVSNPDKVVSSGELTYESQKLVLENVTENDFVKISNVDYSTHYSPQLLENWFPRTENYDPFERVKIINKTLGTNISVIKPEMLEGLTKNSGL